MPEMRKCRGCGTGVAPNAPFGHCPKCLLELGFGPLPEGLDVSPPLAESSERSFADYELIEQIGRGGMGVIYKARQVTLNRLVAIKMVTAGEFASPASIQRFQLEAETAANLHHPNIVPIYETGEHRGQHYFSMELIEGAGLDRYITNIGFSFDAPGEGNRSSLRARQEQMAFIMARIARAVDHAHQHGVLHRDIKPSNVILDRQGEPHLTDFGLAKVIGQIGSSLTVSGAIIGTPSYMAPEQAAGQSKRVTTAADIYSLGAVFYTMLTGRPPFHAETPVQTLKQIVEQEPRHPTTLNEGVDSDLAIICLKCLEKEPQRRYSSAAALADDFDRWLRNEPILARPVGPWGRVRRWCRREPVLAASGIVIIFSLMAATVAALVAYKTAATAAVSEKRRREQVEQNQKEQTEVARRQTELELTRLDQFFQSSTEARVVLPSYQLALLAGRLWDSNGISISLGVYTHSEPARMFKRFAPLAAYLETNVTEFPLRIDLVIYKGYSNLVDALVRGEIGFARPGPASYVLARQSNATILPLAKQLHEGEPIIHGLIFTRAGSTIHTLQDLRGKSFAFGDPDSTFGNYVAKTVLLDGGIRGKDIGPWKHFSTHPAVASAVKNGDYQAGAANSNEVMRVFGGERPRILHYMSSVSFPWVATTNLPPAVATAIAKHLLALRSASILTNIDPDLTGFMTAAPEDYREFEAQMRRADAFSER